MYKKIILIFVGIFLFFGSKFAYADVVINEIMYAPENGINYEWVEIFNNGSDSVDLNKYIFFRGEKFGSLILKIGDNSILQSNEYAIIAKSMSDYSWLYFSGKIFSASTLSLPDNSDKYDTNIKILDPIKLEVDSIKYDTSKGGSKTSKTSLSKIGGEWQAGIPTPGLKNLSSSIDNSDNVEDNITNNNEDNIIENKIETKTKVIEIPKIKTKIISNTLAFTGIPLMFQANTFGYSGEILYYGKYFWNFGDGDSKEQINNFNKFSHTYSYSGEYMVSLEYYANYYSEIPDTLSKIRINVAPLAVVISRVGDEKDFFIELANNSNYETDISKWVLLSSDKTFILPKNTDIPSKSKIILSPKITNFSIGDEKNLKLATSMGEIVFDYGATNINKQINPLNGIKNSGISAEKSENINLGKISNKNTIKTEENNIKNFNDNLFSSAIESDSADKNNPFLFFMGFIVLLIMSGGAVYFIRRNKIDFKKGDDFEILDE